MTHNLHKSNLLLMCNLINNIFLFADEQSDNALEKDNEHDNNVIKSGKSFLICFFVEIELWKSGNGFFKIF